MAIVPCGLIAWSTFNDTYTFQHNTNNLSIDKTDISWKSDRDHKFGSDVFPKNFQKGPLIGGKTLNESIPVCFWVSISLCIIRLLLHMWLTSNNYSGILWPSNLKIN